MVREAPTRRWWIALAAIVLAGAILRYAAATAGLLGDELFTRAVIDHHSLSAWYHDLKTYEANPPGLYFLTWLLHWVWNAPEVVRVIPFACGVALLALMGLTAGRYFGPRAGLAAAAIAAVSPFLVYYGSEGRAYTPAALAVMCAMHCALRGTEEPERRRWWAGYAAAALLGAYLHYTAAFALGAIGLWAFVVCPRGRRPLALFVAGAALLYAPWVPFMRPPDLLVKVVAFLGRTRADEVRFPLRSLVGDPYVQLTDVPGRALGFAMLAVVLAGAALAGVRARELRGRRPAELLAAPATLVLVAAAATPVGTLVYSAFKDDIFTARNMNPSAPALAMSVAWLLTRPRGVWSVVLPALLVAALAYPGGREAFGDRRRPPTDQAAAVLDRVARPQDPVVEVAAFSQAAPLRRALTIYFKRSHRHFLSDAHGNAPWVEGLRTGRVFVTRPIPLKYLLRYLKPIQAGCADPRFRLRRTLLDKRGFVVQEYVARHGADRVAADIAASRGRRDCPPH
jgi:hypothetical protein